MSPSFDPRITAYFGDAVLRAGFMPLPHLFLRHYRALGISANEAMFLLQVMESTWDLADPPRTVNDLANRMGVDARTIRRYTEAAVAAGLVELYEQFDDTGAQVENGYDLSPLFRRLAEFAPEPPLGGSARRRQLRAFPRQSDSGMQAGATSRALMTADKNDRRPPDRNVRRPVDHSVQGRQDHFVQEGRIESSGLKGELRISDHQDIKNADTSCISASMPLWGNRSASQPAGWSLRRNQPLTAPEIQATDDVLQRIGIDLPVRSHVCSTLAPDEAWTLWVYSLAKNWQTPLLITQVYDKTKRQPRAASDLPVRFDDVGRGLASLNPDVAEELLRIIAQHCPHGASATVAAALDPFWHEVGADVVQAVWSMMATLRGSPMTPCPNRGTMTAPEEGSGAKPDAELWSRVLAMLSSSVPRGEFDIWLRQTTLVEVDAEQAIVGTSNIFAREQVETSYRDTISQALAGVLGRPVHVQVVIAG